MKKDLSPTEFEGVIRVFRADMTMEGEKGCTPLIEDRTNIYDKGYVHPSQVQPGEEKMI